MIVNNIDLESALFGQSAADYDTTGRYKRDKNPLALSLFQRTVDQYMSSLYTAPDQKSASAIADKLAAFVESNADTDEKMAYVSDTGALTSINNTKTTVPSNTNAKGPYVNNFDATKYQANDTDEPVNGWTKDRLIKELAKYGYTGTENEDFNKFIKENPDIIKVNWLQGNQGDVQNSVIEITLPTGTKVTVQVGGDAQFLDKDDHIIGVTEGTALNNAKDAFKDVADILADKENITTKDNYLNTVKNIVDNKTQAEDPFAQLKLARKRLTNPLLDLAQDKNTFATSLAASLLDHIRENLQYFKEPQQEEPIT